MEPKLKSSLEFKTQAVLQTTKEIEKHYRQMAILLHPDRNHHDVKYDRRRAKFDIVTAARDVLVNEELRLLYL